MKKIYCFCAFALVMFNTYSQSKKIEKETNNFTFVKCISGDCQNGNGVGEFTTSPEEVIWKKQTLVTYKGSFINGKMDGEGIVYNDDRYYRGSFVNNYFIGNGMAYETKKEGDIIKPDSSAFVSFYLWDEDGCYQSHGMHPDDINFTMSSSGNLNKKHKDFGADFTVFNNDWIRQHVKALKESNKKIYTTEVVSSEIITHDVKKVYLALGKYSVVFNTDMIGPLAQGYKKYLVSADFYKYGTKYHLPYGSSFFYQLINDKGQVVNQQVVQSGQTSNACYFETLPDGKYTVQIAYDFHNCPDCEILKVLKLEVTLYSYDYTYAKFLKNK